MLLKTTENVTENHVIFNINTVFNGKWKNNKISNSITFIYIKPQILKLKNF